MPNIMTIGKELGTPTISISKKTQNIQEDVVFLNEVGFLKIDGGILSFIFPNRDSKALSRINN
jgi:hypothetical protein